MFFVRFVAFFSHIQHLFSSLFAVFEAILERFFGLFLEGFSPRFLPQSDTLKRAVLTATFPVFSVAETFSLTGSAVSAIAVPAAKANDTPLFADMVLVPCLVGTDVSVLITATDEIVSAVSSAHVTVAELIVSALVSIGPKSA